MNKILSRKENNSNYLKHLSRLSAIKPKVKDNKP
jgi:hypothetical protein